MQRKIFVITVDGVEVMRKFAWNTAKQWLTSYIAKQQQYGWISWEFDNAEKEPHGLGYLAADVKFYVSGSRDMSNKRLLSTTARIECTTKD